MIILLGWLTQITIVSPFYSKEKVEKLQEEKGWTIIEDSGRGYRRVVPSLIPIEIIDREAITQ